MTNREALERIRAVACGEVQVDTYKGEPLLEGDTGGMQWIYKFACDVLGVPAQPPRCNFHFPDGNRCQGLRGHDHDEGHHWQGDREVVIEGVPAQPPACHDRLVMGAGIRQEVFICQLIKGHTGPHEQGDWEWWDRGPAEVSYR